MTESGHFESGLGCARAWCDDKPPAHALPGDPRRWPRDRAAAITHLRLQVRLDVDARAVEGLATHTVVPFNDGTREVAFDAVEMTIRGVTVDGRRVRASYDGQTLRVPLPRTAKRGQPLEVSIAYRAVPRIGLYFVGPDDAYPDKPRQVWSQGQDEDSRYWFPCYDAPNNKQTSEVIATVPGGWFALSNGTLVLETEDEGGTRTFHWKQERPHATYLITLVAGEFARIDASRDGLTIDYYVEPAWRASAELTFRNTPRMVELFERVTGTGYPWAKYSQVVVRDFVFGGMENTSATTMTENILFDRKAARDHTSDGIIAHELAHMWFGDLLTCRDWSHGWLNEGFATYAELLWKEHHDGVDEYRQGVLDETKTYLEERYRRPIVTNIYNEPIDIFDRHLYEKGGLVLHTLRGVLGDDAFFRAIQRYVRDNQDRNVVTQDLVDAIEAETGRNLEWFFDQWVYRPGHPKLTVSWSWDGDAKAATVKIKQTQEDEGGTAAFRIPLVIDFRSGDRKPAAFNVEITEREQSFVLPLDERPDLCRVDPYNRVLKELDFDKPLAELTFQLQHDDDIAGRRFAAASLGKKGGPEAVGALERAVREDRFWGVRAAAAEALGTIRTTAARDALLRCLDVREHKARRAVVAALGQFRGDKEVFDALAPLARRDDSYFVEAEANRSIGKLRVDAAFETIASNIDRPSYREVVRAGCLDGLVELRDERAFDLIPLSARYGAPQATRAAAVTALAKLGAFFQERKRPVAEQIAEFLDDPDFRVRIAAMNGLKTLEDPSWAPRLDAMARRELDGRGIRVAREAAAALRKGTQQSEEVKRLRDDLESLRSDNARLRERLEKLEARANQAG
ncbi:MAG: M1 family aminopeptidase [Dehalococcoidia bacterium]